MNESQYMYRLCGKIKEKPFYHVDNIKGRFIQITILTRCHNVNLVLLKFKSARICQLSEVH